MGYMDTSVMREDDHGFGVERHVGGAMSRRLFMKIWYDDDAGEMDGLRCSVEFLSEPLLLQADVLSDTVGVVTKLYRKKVAQWMASLPPDGSDAIH